MSPVTADTNRYVRCERYAVSGSAHLLLLLRKVLTDVVPGSVMAPGQVTVRRLSPSMPSVLRSNPESSLSGRAAFNRPGKVCALMPTAESKARSAVTGR